MRPIGGPLGRLSPKQLIENLERNGAIVRGCPSCEVFYKDPLSLAPWHKASDKCESGKTPHCSCNTCF